MKVNQQIVFLDSQVSNYQSLAKGIISGIEIIILDSGDGIQRITQVLNQKTYSAVHIVSHGSPACLYLGNTQLSLDTLNKYQDDLRTWFDSPNPLLPYSPTLLIYGCNVASGDAGEEFITKLHQITGAEIAASTTPIGNADKGGNWELDVTTGASKPNLAFTLEAQNTYSEVLATVTYSDDPTDISIPDNNTTGISRTFIVTDDLTITDVNFGLDINHATRSHLDITLQHPDGTTIELTTDNGGTLDNLYVNFDDSAGSNITANSNNHNTSGYTNQLKPEQALSAFNNKSSLGTWTLTIKDDTSLTTGAYQDSLLLITGTTDKIFSLGNRIWNDTDNDGQIDTGETGINGVVINLYEDSNNDGTPDGGIIATDTTTNGGYYRFDDLVADNYIVEVAASNFNTGNALEGLVSSSADEVEPDDDIDINDNGIGLTPDPTNGIRSNTITLGTGYSEPTGETDLDPTFPTSTVVTRAANAGSAPSTITYDAIDTIAPNNGNRFQGDDSFARRFEVDATGYGTSLVGFCIEFAEPAVAGTFTPANAASAAPYFNSSYQDSADIPNFFGVDPNADDYGIITQDELDIISIVWANVENTILGNANNAQVLQIIIWELQNDQTFDLTSGNFILDANAGATSTIKTDTQNVINTANTWVNNAETGTWTGSLNLAILTLEDEQDLIVNLDLGVGATDSQSNLTADFGFTDQIDYGDAPDTGTGTGTGNYQTTATDTGASHGIIAGLRIGSTVDADDGTLQNTAATADDNNGSDDEDGVNTFDTLATNASTYSVDVAVTNTTGGNVTLIGWIDFDGNGVFDTDEEAIATVANNATSATLTWSTIPGDITPGDTYARFRISSDALTEANSTGAATDGEVEDYRLTIKNSIAGTGKSETLTNTTADVDDIFTGGSGQDTLTGNSGDDTFYFTKTSDGIDIITDFDATNGDKLDFSAIAAGELGGVTVTNDLFTDGYINAKTFGTGVMIQVDLDGADDEYDKNVVLLTGVSVGDIDASDFIF